MTQANTNKSIAQKAIIPAIALIMLLFMVAWLAGAFDNKIAPTLNNAFDNQTHPAIIDNQDSYTLTARTEAIFEPVAASLAAKQATIISTRILARIERINARASSFVKKGDLLVLLEKDDLQSQVLQSKEKVNALQARHSEAKQNLERATELFKAELISAFELDKKRTNHQTINAELTAAKQALSQARTSLDYASLIAPIDGRIVDRFAEPGDTVQPGTKILSLYNPLSLRVEAQVREQLALTLMNGQNIAIELPSLNIVINSEIEEIVPAANTGSRSFLIKARIPHQEKLLPGMYARMLIPAGEQTQLSIPTSMLARVGQLDFVYLSIEGEIQRRLVRLGKKNKNMVNVISGLKTGDIIFRPQ